MTFNVKGKTSQEGATSGSIEGKIKHNETGISHRLHSVTIRLPRAQGASVQGVILLQPVPEPLARARARVYPRASLLTTFRRAGVAVTQTWTTANSLDTKVELEDPFTKGLKAELLANFVPHSRAYGAKTNLHYRLPQFFGRAFFDLTKGPTATVDGVFGKDGFLVGAEAGYDVQKAAITKYSTALGYTGTQYSATLTAANNISLFSAAYYHKVNSQTEAGAKAVWDSKAGNNVALEVAAKHRLDPSSFVKASHLPVPRYR